MTRPRIVVPFVAAMIVLGVVRAHAEEPPPEVAGARRHERYVIRPGTEPLFADMLGRGETLPGGCTLRDGKIDRVSVTATYGCADGDAVLELLHPTGAASGGVRTERFLIIAKSGAASARLVEAVAERIRAHEAAFAWTEIADAGAAKRRWPVAVAAAVAVVAVAVILALQIRRRRAAQ
ncbi:MAG: hypothetical protein OZ922_17255 [Myxococcales bacterium]|nr:hypothetical protein [Myxococcales bacterium]